MRSVLKAPRSGSRLLKKLSIVTLAYRDAAGLEKTAKSLKPLLKNPHLLEWLVIDSSPEIHAPVLDQAIELRPFLKHAVQSPPQGIYPAMNLGIQNAAGDYIWFLNSGDALINSEVLNQALKKLDDHAIVILGANLYRHGEFLNPVLPSLQMEKNLQGINRVCHQAVIADISTLKDGFSTDYKLISDYVHLFEAWQKGTPIAVLPQVLVEYDMGGASSKWREALREFGHFARKMRHSPAGTQNWMAFHKENLRIRATKLATEGPLSKWVDPLVRKFKRRKAKVSRSKKD